jgi:hypothetical protein
MRIVLVFNLKICDKEGNGPQPRETNRRRVPEMGGRQSDFGNIARSGCVCPIWRLLVADDYGRLELGELATEKKTPRRCGKEKALLQRQNLK